MNIGDIVRRHIPFKNKFSVDCSGDKCTWTALPPNDNFCEGNITKIEKRFDDYGGFEYKIIHYKVTKVTDKRYQYLVGREWKMYV